MSRSILNEDEFYKKVYGGWLGKNIGGTLGGPVEGAMDVLTLDFYPELNNLPLANDDLDLQLVALHALERHGARLSAKELGLEWLEHVSRREGCRGNRANYSLSGSIARHRPRRHA